VHTPIQVFRLRLWRLPLLLTWLLIAPNLSAEPSQGRITGKVLDPQGATVTGARVSLLNAAGTSVRETTSDPQGDFVLEDIGPGSYQLSVEARGFLSVITNIGVSRGQQQVVTAQFQQVASAVQSMTVVASAPSSLSPDPAQSIVVHDEVLDANPGRPGAPISIPGLPIETASGGIKAPQYFAPGVAPITKRTSRNSSRSAIFFSPTSSQPTPTATASLVTEFIPRLSFLCHRFPRT